MPFPTTYLGTDTSCLTDLTTIDILVSNNLMLAQRLMRRLTVPEGAMNIIDPDANSALSIDLNAYVNTAITDQVVLTLQQTINACCLADQEVLDVTTQVIPPKQNRILQIIITAKSANGPFSLTIGVDQLNAQLLYEVNG